MTNKMIDTEAELLNVVDFVKQTWVLPNFTDEELISFIRIPFEAGLEGAKDWCKNHELFFAIYNLYNYRSGFPKKEYNQFLMYDGYFQFIESIADGFRNLQEVALNDWNYEKFCQPYISQARKLIKNKKIHPKPYGKLAGTSYKKLREDFFDFDTLGYFDDKEENGMTQHDKEKSLFKGIFFENSPFIQRITLHNVLHSDINQGRDPLTELFHAIITYGLNIAEFNNTVGAIDVIKSINIPDNFCYDLPELPKHKFIQACYYAGNKGFQKLTPEIKEKTIKHKAYMDSLTPEELKEKKKEEEQKINDMMNSLISDIKKEEKEKPIKKSLTLSEIYKIIDIKNF